METDLGKKDVRVTLSSYDFLAYFIPGATFITIILVIESYYYDNIFKYQNRILPFYDIINKIKAYFLSPESHWSLEIVILVLFVIFSYMLGHILASSSAFILDRILVGNLLKYPYIVLLRLPSEIGRSELLRVILFLSFVFNLALILSLFNEILFKYLILITIFIIFLSYLSFQNYFIRKNGNNFIKIFLYLINKLFTLKIPFKNFSIEGFVNFSRYFLIKFLGIYEEFSDEFISKFKGAYKKVFNSKIEDDKILVYWNCRNYIIDKNPHFNSLLVNWFNLYSFSRNLLTCLYFSFIYLVFILRLNFELYNNLTDSFFHENAKFYSIKITIILVFLLSIIMLIRYYYLYYTYYNKYLFRTFYYLVNQKES